MAAQLGRTFLLKVDATGSGSYQTVGSARTKTMKIADEAVDVTTADSSNQWRELLANAGVKSMEITINGIFGDDTYINLVHTLCTAGTIRNWQLTHPSWGTYTGAFHIDSFELTGDYNGALEYSASLSSAGELTFSAL